MTSKPQDGLCEGPRTFTRKTRKLYIFSLSADPINVVDFRPHLHERLHSPECLRDRKDPGFFTAKIVVRKKWLRGFQKPEYYCFELFMVLGSSIARPEWTVPDDVGLVLFDPPFLVTSSIWKRSSMPSSACASLECRLLQCLLHIICAKLPSIN